MELGEDMNEKTTLTFAFMDPPFESERTITFFRLLDSALDHGANIHVFAYEGAVALGFSKQQAHGNGMHNRDTEEENHPLTKDWISALRNKADSLQLEFNWVNCGLCVDERGVLESVHECKRGSPADFWQCAAASINTLAIGTR